MSKVERFEDLKCWQEARKLVRDIYILFQKQVSLQKIMILKVKLNEQPYLL
jgi:hypothetical protein